MLEVTAGFVYYCLFSISPCLSPRKGALWSQLLARPKRNSKSNNSVLSVLSVLAGAMLSSMENSPRHPEIRTAQLVETLTTDLCSSKLAGFRSRWTTWASQSVSVSFTKMMSKLNSLNAEAALKEHFAAGLSRILQGVWIWIQFVQEGNLKKKHRP